MKGFCFSLIHLSLKESLASALFIFKNNANSFTRQLTTIRISIFRNKKPAHEVIAIRNISSKNLYYILRTNCNLELANSSLYLYAVVCKTINNYLHKIILEAPVYIEYLITYYLGSWKGNEIQLNAIK